MSSARIGSRVAVGARAVLGGSLALGAFLSPCVGLAQGVRVTATQTAALEEVVVTAQKREQSLQDVPISIEVVTGAVLENDAIKNFEEIDERVPNLVISRSPGADAIYMRGIGSGAGSPSLDQSVVMFVDGIYGGHARQFQTPFLDIARVEVLRGPQGALVGKNTTAGAISIVSAMPTPEFSANVGAEYDFEREGPTLTAMASGPVGEKFGLRGAVKYQDLGGYIYNSLTNDDEPTREEAAGRLIGRYTGERVTATGKVEYTKLEGEGNPYVMTSAIRGRKLDRTKENKSALGKDFDDNDTQNAVLTLDFSLGEHTLTSITGYSAYETHHGTDADFFEGDLAYSTFDEDFDQTSQEFRLLSPTGQTVEYVLGAYWHTADLTEGRATGALFAPPASTRRVFEQSSDTYSLYAQLTWNLSEQFALVGSARYTSEDKDARYVRIGGPLSFTQGTGTVQADITDSLSESEVDPAATLQWRPSDSTMLYASYSQGSKSGGFQGAIPNATASTFEFRPESSEAYEVGLKMNFESRAYLNVAIFDTSYEDLQVSSAVQSNPNVSVFAFFTGNAAEATSRGVEANGSVALGERWRIDASLAYLDAEFDSYQDGPCATGQAPNNPMQGSCILTGVDLPFAPKWSGFVTVGYDTPLGSGDLVLEVSATASFRDDARMEFPNDPVFIQEAYAKYDLRVALSSPGRWEVAVLGKNLSDEYTFGFGGTGNLAATPGIGLAPDARMLPLDPVRTVVLQGRLFF